MSKECLFSTYAFQRYVRGIAFDRTGNFVHACGDDLDINIYHVNKSITQFQAKKDLMPVVKLVSKTSVQGLDCSYSTSQFVTGGQVVQLWSQERTNPIMTWNWVLAE